MWKYFGLLLAFCATLGVEALDEGSCFAAPKGELPLSTTLISD